MSDKNRVLIAGGGPVGFTLAYNLARRGIPSTILEGSDRIFDDPRAGTIHPPTLEMFDEIGVTPTMMERGYKVTHYQYRDRKQGVIADFQLGILESETKFPFRLMLEQHKICYILQDLLKDYADCEVLMQHRVMDVTQDGEGVTTEFDHIAAVTSDDVDQRREEHVQTFAQQFSAIRFPGKSLSQRCEAGGVREDYCAVTPVHDH